MRTWPLAELAFNSVGDGGADDGNVDEVTLGVLNALANRFGNFGSLAHADTDADPSSSPTTMSAVKRKVSAALNDLCDTVDGDEPFLEFRYFRGVSLRLFCIVYLH